MKTKLMITMLAIVSILTSCSDQAVETVKSGTMDAYSHATIGAVFEANFDNTTWTAEETGGKKLVLFEGEISPALHEKMALEYDAHINSVIHLFSIGEGKQYILYNEFNAEWHSGMDTYYAANDKKFEKVNADKEALQKQIAEQQALLLKNSNYDEMKSANAKVDGIFYNKQHARKTRLHDDIRKAKNVYENANYNLSKPSFDKRATSKKYDDYWSNNIHRSREEKEAVAKEIFPKGRLSYSREVRAEKEALLKKKQKEIGLSWDRHFKDAKAKFQSEENKRVEEALKKYNTQKLSNEQTYKDSVKVLEEEYKKDIALYDKQKADLVKQYKKYEQQLNTNKAAIDAKFADKLNKLNELWESYNNERQELHLANEKRRGMVKEKFTQKYKDAFWPAGSSVSFKWLVHPNGRFDLIELNNTSWAAERHTVEDVCDGLFSL